LPIGIKRIKSHVLGGKYSLLQAKRDASRVAIMVSIIRDGNLDIDFEKVRKNRLDLEIVKNINLTDKFSILNKLKNISPESFYLWAVVNKAI